MQPSASYIRFASLSALVLTLVFVYSGCSSAPKPTSSAGGKPLSGTDEQIFLGDTIEKNFDPNVIMKRGEAFFDKEEYAEAIVEYQHFLDLHHSHMLAPYAQYRLGETHFKMAKSIDRDPDPIHRAIAALEKLRKEFPGSRYDIQAVQKIQECHDWLAQTHLFVGQFYYRRDSFLAAAHRFELIMKEYPDKEVAPDALYFLALSYKEMGANDWASEKLTLLADKYPGNKYESEGRKLLAKLGGSKPQTLVASSEPPAAAGPNTKTIALQPNGLNLQPASFTSGSSATTLRAPTGGSLAPSFTACRIGAWC